ncbi:MAG: amidohydrolase, partial [Pseudonocardiaceae bacterium]
DPWGAVRAATAHRNAGSAIGVMEALAAHAYGGYRAAAVPDPLAGVLSPGAPASYAIWDNADFAGFPPAGTPSCLRTVHQGRILFEREGALV